jgi:RNA-directed DNA polymerase
MDGESMPHRRLLLDGQGRLARAIFNLVVPLAHEATAKRTTGTTRRCSGRPGAVTPLIGASLRRGDVDSTNGRSTLPIPLTRGTRISTMAIRTTTTRRTKAGRALSADQCDAGFSLEQLAVAYFDCRRSKRNTPSALAFEQNLERNLIQLHDELQAGTYKPGRSICFVVTRPKAREVWAADFRDRVVHHLLYNKISPRFYASFIKDTCACIPGRGTLYAAQRLEAKIRSATENWSKPVWYLKCDLANFFVAIDKSIVLKQLAKRISEPWWMALAKTILMHDPREDYEMRGAPALLERVSPHKRLANQPATHGLPIGNLSSQFFANVYLDALDQHMKHKVRACHYIRYVDDFILLHDSPQWLNGALAEINRFLPNVLGAQLNPSKTILQPVTRGVDFVGHVIKPWCVRARRRTVHQAINRIASMPAADVFGSANSYFGLLRQSDSSHADRAALARAVMNRGHCVNHAFTKSYRTTQGVTR